MWYYATELLGMMDISYLLLCLHYICFFFEFLYQFCLALLCVSEKSTKKARKIGLTEYVIP